MAARENQGYLIAVIVLVLLTLVLALLSFLGWSKAGEYAESKASAEASLNVEKKVKEAHQIEAEILRALVGDLGESSAEVPTKIDSVRRLANNNSLTDAQKTAIQNVVVRVDEVKEAYDRDMQHFKATTEDDQAEELTWSGVVRNLNAVASRLHNQLSVKRLENEDEKARLGSEKKALEDRLGVVTKQLNDKNEELKKVQQLSNDKETELQNMLAKAKADVDSYRSNLGSKIANLTSQNEQLTSSNQELEQANADLAREKQELTRENFDIHDGEIVRVARTSNLVFLNIGKKDGLRTNQTFAVYDKNVNNFEKGQQKAKIEVIRVTGPKSADARITEEDPINPITRYDLIVTPTWDPGYRVPIAISGIIDLDGDGLSDRLQFVRMIENNGGRVVAQHDEDGKVMGQIDSSTRYLVKGDSPKPGPAGENTDIYGAIRTLENQAIKHSVQTIDVRRMLNRMGRHLNPVFRNNPGVQDVNVRGQGSGTRNQGSANR